MAGGAVLSLLQSRIPRDYDIFFINKIPVKFIEKIKKTDDCIESLNCITIKVYESFYDREVQFIKRVYDNPARVIGGFDLDACRFYMDHNGDVYGTATAVETLLTKNLYINPCCQSENFVQRLHKYRSKKFNLKHPGKYFNTRLFKRNNDYDIDIGNGPFLKKVLIMILCGKSNKCVIKNNQKIKLSFLMSEIKKMNTNTIHGLLSVLIGNPINSELVDFELINKILEEQYEKYEKLTDFLISNTSSQMTASFHPTNYKMSEIYPGIKFDIFKDHLRACFQVIYFSRLPKVITYKIFRDYYDLNLLL